MRVKYQRKFLVVIGVLGMTVAGFFLCHLWLQKVNPAIRPVIKKQSVNNSVLVAKTNTTVTIRGFTVRASEFTQAEKKELATLFKVKFRPAITNWSAAYENHLPFRPDDVTFENFHSRLGKNLYTFMVGDITLTIADSPDGAAHIFYLMTRAGALELNKRPSLGAAPNLSVPVQRQDVIRMVKADTGITFSPNQVVIKPTGAASSLMGGAFVDIGPDAGNGAYRSFTKSNLSMVFGADGNLVNYQR